MKQTERHLLRRSTGAWAAALGVSARALRNWRAGRDQKQGIVPLLDQWLAAAYAEAGETLEAAGLSLGVCW
jgi:hypothetical protein